MAEAEQHLQDRLKALLEERRYLIDKWHTTERDMFLAIVAVVGFGPLLSAAGVPAQSLGFAALLTIVLSLIFMIMIIRLSVLADQVKYFNDRIRELDLAFSYEDAISKLFGWELRWAGPVSHLANIKKAYFTLLCFLLILLWIIIVLLGLPKESTR